MPERIGSDRFQRSGHLALYDVLTDERGVAPDADAPPSGSDVATVAARDETLQELTEEVDATRRGR